MPPNADLPERARRLGPLPYSVLGLGPAPALPPDVELGAWEAELMDRWWTDLGRPDPFTVVEVAAGDGSRSREVLALGPECLEALRYVLVEPDAGLRARHEAALSIEAPMFLSGPRSPGSDDDDDDDLRPADGIGPRITSLEDLPVVAGPTGIFAVGWASRLPSDRLEFREGRWWEVRLAAAAGGLEEISVPLDADRSAEAAALVRGAPEEGGRYAVLKPAASWLAQAVRVAPAGWLAVVDHWASVTAPVPAGEAPPLALDQLRSVRRPEGSAPVPVLTSLSVVCWRLG